MSVAQVAFEIPPAIQLGLDAGTLIRYGGVVRDQAGHIVKHLKEVPVLQNAEAAKKAIPMAKQNAGAVEKFLQFAKKNKYLLIGATVVTAIVGGVTYIVIKNKKGEQVAIPKCVVDFNAALMDYIDAIRKRRVSEKHIDAVLNALDQIKENQAKGIVDGDFSFENAELLLEMIRSYTEKLATANGYEMPEDVTLHDDNIIDLQTYLNIQKRVFAAS